MITLLCTVRGCGLPLEEAERMLRCPGGHSFDRARSGYANLLQPQDRRSARPGDRKEAVLARRRLLDQGYGTALVEALAALVGPIPPVARILDVGCGEGTHLGRLAARLQVEATGIDIAVPAIALAAARYPEVEWVVVNADRWLPYPDGSFDVIASITARRNPAEFARVLRPEGKLFIAVPAPDDLAELRAAVQGESAERSRIESVMAELRGHFELNAHETIRERRALERDALLDLLDATYRGRRRRDQERVAALERLEVTFAWEVMVFGRG